MRPHFPLFNTPIDLAQAFWEQLLQAGDIALDATCGNGKDSLFLARCLQKQGGSLHCIDIQEEALKKTKDLLELEVPTFLPYTVFHHQSHEHFPLSLEESLKLIVFNLGYLPTGNPSLTTLTSSTLKGVEQAKKHLCPGGVISITCYPGHLEGGKEEQALLEYLSSSPPKAWCFTTFFWPNRKLAPSLFLLQKKEKE